MPRRTSRATSRDVATAAGTRRLRDRFADRFAADFYRPFGKLQSSSIGFGSYLGACDEADDAAYRHALPLALGEGINLIDTAINYRCQRSERDIGAALRDAVAAGVVTRDEVIICTKGGYLPLDDTTPATREEYQTYVQREYFETGIMAPADLVAGGHSLAVPFIDNQIDRSRSNLGIDAIDVYYLHNPEQQLDVVQPARFRTMLRPVFAMLEARVAAGDIGCYGCATWNGFRVPPGTRGHLSLHDLVMIAREVGGDDHHFRVVQLPVNLAMTEALRAPTQRLGSTRTVPLLQAAAELDISVVASATLMQAKLAGGLPEEVREALPAFRTDAQRAIGFVRSLPAVLAALVGMKTLAHVTENIESGRVELG
jgi:aryl-alcohol dehydrogenase-like predicted oxidoreductase